MPWTAPNEPLVSLPRGAQRNTRPPYAGRAAAIVLRLVTRSRTTKLTVTAAWLTITQVHPYDEVINALRKLFAKSGKQLGQVIVLTEKDLSLMKELMEQLDHDSQAPLAKRIRNEIIGAGTQFHTVTIKFPGFDSYDIVLDDPD